MEEEKNIINIEEAKKEMNVEEKGINIEDITYRLEEMLDAMDNSICNIEKINNEQTELIEIIENSNKAEKFNDFVNDTKQQMDNMNNQKNQLILKKEILKQIIDKCKNDSEISKYISMLSYLIGLFK